MKTTSYLDKLIDNKKQEIQRLIHEAEANPSHYLNKVLSHKYSPSKRFSSALKKENLSIIAEIKRKSPSLGNIRSIDNSVELALKYCQGGASAISVLTDFQGFGGSLFDMNEVSRELKLKYSNISVLRKDFIFHPLQLAEAVFFGADAVLLIVRVVEKNLSFLIKEAENLGLEVLTEVHNLNELELALEAEASIIGINHRNLSTFDIDLSISRTLKPLIPSHIVTVAESGIHTPEQALQMKELGFDAILVGEALVRSQDPLHLIQLMLGAENES